MAKGQKVKKTKNLVKKKSLTNLKEDLFGSLKVYKLSDKTEKPKKTINVRAGGPDGIDGGAYGDG